MTGPGDEPTGIALQGTAVVTGAGSGIGRALALALADRAMTVVCADRDDAATQTVATKIRERGGHAVAVPTDVADAAAVERLAGIAFDEVGDVRLLCNNAGVFRRLRAVEEALPGWRQLLDVNLFGGLNGIVAFKPRLLAQGGPAWIVNTASAVGVAPSARSLAYTTSKYALVGMSEALALELEDTGIGLSILCPGPVLTAMYPTPVDGAPTGALRPGAPLAAEVVARLVLAAVEQGRRWVFTDGAVRDRLEPRHRVMVEDLDWALAQLERA